MTDRSVTPTSRPSTSSSSPPPSAPEPAGLAGPVVLFMSLAAALGTSAIYVLQPAVGEVAGSLGTGAAEVGVALAWGPVGYLIGLIALVPLVDRFAPGTVLGLQFLVLGAAMAASAAVGSTSLLALLVAVTGVCSVVGAGMSSLAGRLADPHRRAAVLGVVTAGISVGILAGRTVGGLLAEELGWPGMLLCFAGACAVFATCCLVVLPRSAPASYSRGYLASIRSIPGLFVRYATLRIAAVRGALWFFAFCAVWAGLAVALVQAPYSRSPEQVGLYALAGLTGLVATQVAGRWTDRVGARRVILVGLVLALAAAVTLGFVLSSMVAAMVCLAVFDAGLFAAQVANQSTVLAIDPCAPARFNSGYMVVYFVGGSLGTAAGSAAVDRLGWTFTTVASASLILLALVVTVLVREAPAAPAQAN